MAKVKYLGKMRALTGVARESIEVESVGGLIEALAERDERLRRLLFREGRFNPDIQVLVNGRNKDFLDDLETVLGDEDQVTFFVHGARGFPGG
jgi:MoaD family protein